MVHRNGRVKSGIQSFQTSICIDLFSFFSKEVNQLVYAGVAPGGSQVYQVASMLFNLSTFLEASVKRHFYYSMKNCTSPDDVRRSLLTMVSCAKFLPRSR